MNFSAKKKRENFEIISRLKKQGPSRISTPQMENDYEFPMESY